jgi:hypothetical protein
MTKRYQQLVDYLAEGGQAAVDSTGCVGNTIKCAAGHYLDLANPSPKAIDIESIAAALSKICRFGGHTPRFYSVAEHVCHASYLSFADGVPLECTQAVFLHDAAEAYLGDVVKPLKNMLPEYVVVESRMERAIAEAFGVDFERWAEEIKLFDRQMLKAEKLALWPGDREVWSGFTEIKDRIVRFGFWSPETAEQKFLCFAELFGFSPKSELPA